LPLLMTTDKIASDDARESIRLSSLPVSALSGSTVVADGLAERLLRNSELRALKSRLHIPDDEWTDFLRKYAGTFVKFGARSVLNDLKRGANDVYGDYVIIAIEDGEAYELAGVDDFRDMIKFYKV